MGETPTPTYEQLVAIVERLQSRLDEQESSYIRIRRETATDVPSSLDGGEAVLTSTGIHVGVDGGVKTALWA